MEDVKGDPEPREGGDDSMWRRIWIWKRKGKNGSTYCLRWHDDRGRIHTESVG